VTQHNNKTDKRTHPSLATETNSVGVISAWTNTTAATSLASIAERKHDLSPLQTRARTASRWPVKVFTHLNDASHSLIVQSADPAHQPHVSGKTSKQARDREIDTHTQTDQ
jgi:hypothetical protein